MSFTGTIVTGLLGYNLRKEFLSEGFAYRETEVFDYTVYVNPAPLTLGFSGIQQQIKNQFANIYSGDINVQVFEVPSSYDAPANSIQLGEFKARVEIRRPILDLSTYMPEIGAAYYSGIDTTFWANNCTNLNDFSDEILMEENGDGNKVYSHNLSFSIRTGGKPVAISIASGIFAQDKNTTFGIASFVGGVSISEDANYQNYYTESHDLLRNSYSFSKKREILSASSSTYTYNLSHSLNVGEDGIVTLIEKGDVIGKLTFAQAQNGAGDLLGGSYARCNTIYNNYRLNIFDSAISEVLVNIPLVTNKTFNRPSLSVNYDINYTNNPNYNSSTNASVEKTIDVNYDGKYTNINHNYSFIKFISPTYSGIDNNYIGLIDTAYAASPSEISSFYTTSPFYTVSLPNINRISFGAITPNRKKNFSINFNYTNRPTNFITLTSITYPFLDYKITDNKPLDEISEYQIINRPNKNSLVNYGYQTKNGNKTIDITARISRDSNPFTSPITNLSVYINDLYRFGLRKLLETFNGQSFYALTYSLLDAKYSLDSNNSIKLSIVIDYSVKKYLT